MKKQNNNKHISLLNKGDSSTSAHSTASISGGVHRTSSFVGPKRVIKIDPVIPPTNENPSARIEPNYFPDNNYYCLNEASNPQLYYDGNNYYQSSSMSSTIVPQQQDRFSYDSGRGSDRPPLPISKIHPISSNRASVQSYESTSSSNKDSETSQQSSSISSSSTSSSFCSSASSSHSITSSSPSSLRNQTLSSSSSACSSHQDSAFLTPNNVFHEVRKPHSSNNMKNELKEKAGHLTIAEMLLHGVSDPDMIHVWLQKINMVKYEKNFIDAGYDMPTIARMTPQDLTSIEITDPQDRSVLHSEILKLKIPEKFEEKLNTLEEWLKMLNLDCYYESLCQQGYHSIDKVIQLTWEDLEDVGIKKLGHQKKISLAIKKMKSMKMNPDNNKRILDTVDSHNNIPNSIYSISTGKSTNPNISATSEITIDNANQEQQQPYQDVMIKMYANNNQQMINSPTHVPDRSRIEICHFDTKRNTIVFQPASPLFVHPNRSQKLHTFQQQQNNQPQLPQQSFQQANNRNPMLPFYPDNNNQIMSNQINAYSRRRSLESLNVPPNGTIDNNNQNIPNVSANSFSNYHSMRPPFHQYSNCDLTSSPSTNNYHTSSFYHLENNPKMMIGHFNKSSDSYKFNNHPNLCNYEPTIDGTSTLNRPKQLLKQLKFSLPHQQPTIVPRPQEYSCSSLPSPSSGDLIKSNYSSSSSEIYSSFSNNNQKKKPPPPPRRVNSIRETTSSISSSSSMPSTPIHGLNRTKSIDSGNNNFDYLPDSPLLMTTSQQQHNSLNIIKNENLFASCVQSMTNNFSNETTARARHSPFENMSKVISNNNHQKLRLTPLNNNNNNNDQLNISSSSSAESMYFAHDNVGTIRQRSIVSNSPQSQFKSPPVSTPSTPSSNNLPIMSSFSSTLNDTYHHQQTPISLNSSDHQRITGFLNNHDDSNNQTASKHFSLEHIEMMLADLKTQLDSIG